MRNEIRNNPYSNVHFMHNPIGDIGDTDSVILPLIFLFCASQALEISNSFIMRKVPGTEVPVGVSLSSDKGKTGGHSIEYNRAKTMDNLGYIVSYPIECALVKDCTGDGLTNNKADVFDRLGLSADQVPNVVAGHHCDRQYDHENLKVLPKMKAKWNLPDSWIDQVCVLLLFE